MNIIAPLTLFILYFCMGGFHKQAKQINDSMGMPVFGRLSRAGKVAMPTLLPTKPSGKHQKEAVGITS